MIDVVAYELAHLPGIIALAAAEGWPSLQEDLERAHRVLTAPGVTTVVAMTADHTVAGFAQIQSDGEIQAHLSLIAVAHDRRREGIGRRLVDEGLRRAGGIRIDLVTDEAGDFYRALRHKRLEGYRLYPEP